MSIALITGASKGIGKAIAIELAKKKYNLLLIARDEELLKTTCEFIEKEYAVIAQYIAIDLSDSSAVQKIYDHVIEQNLDIEILVNNAGYGLSGYFDKYPLNEIINMMNLNMQTVVQLTHQFLPLLKERKQAYILNVASSAAYQAVPCLSVYAASKSFVLSFSRGLHQELRSSNVSVTCISPGPTNTAFVERANLGKKGLEAAEKVNMQPQEVAIIAVNALFRKKQEVITGTLNKLGAFMSWLLPKKWIERITMKLYQ
jgi:short-subunit dehydrogenase